MHRLLTAILSGNVEVRWLLVATAVAFSSPAAAQFFEALPGSETPAAVETQAAVDAPPPTPVPVTEASVIITPIPMPASVVELVKPLGSSPKLRVARKARPASKPSLPKILLSRTERHQLALLVASSNPGDPLRKFLHDQNDGETGYDQLTLHRCYSRPRLVQDAPADDPEADDLSDTVKLRLLLARLKAVEAHALAQVGDPEEELPGHIRQRLAEARNRAVAAHRRAHA